MDLALDARATEHADLVLAHDPDADRLAVAVRDENGSLVQLTGNQLGVLLGHYLLTEGPRGSRGRLDHRVVAHARSHARERGASHDETLTGFKWIATRGLELEREGRRFVFGYEEAIGYAMGSSCATKTASAPPCCCRARGAREGEGEDALDSTFGFYRSYGLYTSLQKSVVMPGADGVARIAAYMSRLRRAHRTSSVGGPSSNGATMRQERSSSGAERPPTQPTVQQCARLRARGWLAPRHSTERHRAQAEVLRRPPRGDGP